MILEIAVTGRCGLKAGNFGGVSPIQRNWAAGHLHKTQRMPSRHVPSATASFNEAEDWVFCWKKMERPARLMTDQQQSRRNYRHGR